MPDLDHISHSQLLLQYLYALETLTVETGAARYSPDTRGMPVQPVISRPLSAPQDV
jgi:hypothetical protein